MEMMLAAKDVRTGDQMQLESGEWVTVTASGRKVFGSPLIEWKHPDGKADWEHFGSNQQVRVRREHATR